MEFKIQKTLLLLIITLLFSANTACEGSTSFNPGLDNINQEKTNAAQISNQELSVNESASSNLDGFHYEIQDVNFVQNGEKLVIYANVANTGQDAFISTQYNLSLLAGNGSVVATDRTFIQTDIVPPGKTSPIWFFVDNPPVWDSYEIVVADQGMQFGDFDGEVVDVFITPTTGQA